MNVLPMILRFVSGSLTPSSLERNTSSASSNCRLMPSSPCSRVTTSELSSLRRHPLSTRIAWKRFPMALCMSTAATVESTPPDTAPITCPLGPTVTRTCSMKRSASSVMFHVVGAWHTPTTKLASTSLPRGECVTSGWNCRPYIFFSLFPMAAKGHASVTAATWKPSGRVVTLSPWLIHICSPSSADPCSKSPANNSPPPPPAPAAAFVGGLSMAFPNSRVVEGETLPPNVCVISCMP
mmetsp:Transcript_69985/g.137585  ORF Transcript_69985/g.137585 Transcript_69985/m.137585 type:complete len:238 (+) Transcript_69985:571-1284(+)